MVDDMAGISVVFVKRCMRPYPQEALEEVLVEKNFMLFPDKKNRILISRGNIRENNEVDLFWYIKKTWTFC